MTTYMTSSKPLLLLVALISAALLGIALYLQLAMKMLPCPLCVLQRYAFAVLALGCFLGALVPRGASGFFARFGIMTAVVGAGIAGWHLWVKAHPAVSCGIDPLETSLNMIPSARLFPLLFQADGLCTTDYPPIMGLSIPQWSLFWFIVFAALLMTSVMRPRNGLR
ncbi:MAG: disulfide bond formation protein B [Burkholderiaceae bacterium]